MRLKIYLEQIENMTISELIELLKYISDEIELRAMELQD